MRLLAPVVLSFSLVFGLAACGDDNGGGSGQKQDDGQVATEFGTAKPEDVRASAAEVADGFTQLGTYVDEVVAKLGVDDAATTEAQERLLTIWESILGTVKATDAAAYSKLDAALKTLMDAKGADGKTAAQAAATTVHEAGTDYVKRYPGDATSAPDSGATDTGGNGY
jgi:hypothetical protein